MKNYIDLTSEPPKHIEGESIHKYMKSLKKTGEELLLEEIQHPGYQKTEMVYLSDGVWIDKEDCWF